MSKTYTITLIDEINCHIDGLTGGLLTACKKSVGFPVKGAYMTVAFQMDEWDGKEYYLSDDGFTFTYFLDRIIDVMKKMGVKDNQFVFQDERDYDRLDDVDLEVDEDFLLEETGKTLRDYQLFGVNTVLKERKGVLSFATNAGKILINLAVCKALDPHCKTISIVPGSYLADQTAQEFSTTNLSYKVIDAKVKPKNRQKEIDDHRHIIITKKLFTTSPELFSKEQFAVIGDEAHVAGENFLEALRFNLNESVFRIGMTGSFPKDKHKAELIKAHLGGGIIGRVKNEKLIEDGHSSRPKIEMIATHHEEFISQFPDQDHFTWDIEDEYLKSNQHRLNAIHQYIKSLDTKNTLILSSPQVAKYMADKGGEHFITQETTEEERKRLFQLFDETDGHHYLWGSFETVSTGISVDRIFRVIFIDVGKVYHTILQGIGRGLRKCDETGILDVIDIYSDTKYGNKHKKERVKIYKDEKFEYRDSKNFIQV